MLGAVWLAVGDTEVHQPGLSLGLLCYNLACAEVGQCPVKGWPIRGFYDV